MDRDELSLYAFSSENEMDREDPTDPPPPYTASYQELVAWHERQTERLKDLAKFALWNAYIIRKLREESDEQAFRLEKCRNNVQDNFT